MKLSMPRRGSETNYTVHSGLLIGAAFASLLVNWACSSDKKATDTPAGSFDASGGSSAGGAADVGGTIAQIGTTSSGGSVSAAGATGVGGARSLGGGSGTGCRGSFEAIQDTTGLCVANTVTITGAAGDAGIVDYSIDATEVTQGQYDDWLLSNPEKPPSTDKSCGWNTSFAEQATGYTGVDAEHHPVVNVDWCDARAYCSAVGKRLCGAIEGGSVEFSASYADASSSQWYRVCSSAGTLTFPYGNSYEASNCNGATVIDARQNMQVGSLRQCVASASGYAGVYDLSGNVSEWEDSCESSGQLAFCRLRGGSFYSGDGDSLACNSDMYDNRNGVSVNVGFRCCSFNPSP